MRFYLQRRRRCNILVIFVTFFLLFCIHRISESPPFYHTLWSAYARIINDRLGNEDTVNFEEFEMNRTAQANKGGEKYKGKFDENLRNVKIEEYVKIKIQRDHVENGLRNKLTASMKFGMQTASDKIRKKFEEQNLDPMARNDDTERNHTIDLKLKNSESLPDHQIVQIESGSNKCEAAIYYNQTWQAPYKLYIYELPAEFNVNLIRYMHLPELDNCGFGPIMYEERGDVSYHNTWQFALDVILHHKLMYSPYRTHNPHETDVFFIPFYEASHCFCKRHYNTSYKGKALEEALISEIHRLPYYRQGKLHLLPVAKIEREEMSPSCPLLKYDWTWNVTLIGIEALESRRTRAKYHPYHYPPFIAAPYPSYGHFQHPDGGKYHQTIFSTPRRVFVFLAASGRRSNPFRNRILDMFPNTTSVSIDQYYRLKQISTNQKLHSMRLDTPEGLGNHQVPTMQWMRNSVFCLQPAGDSPTRKSFYDGIISGCIPVLFKLDYQPIVTYPFQDVLDYSKFTVTVPTNQTFQDVLEPYEKDPNKVVELQKHLYEVIPMMQYSYPVDNKPHTDAVQMILHQVGKTLSIQRNNLQL